LDLSVKSNLPGCLGKPPAQSAFKLKEHLMGDPYDSSAERTSVLGPTLRFKGELHADEELLIRGQIEGSITHSQRITVCGEGIVKANIRAQTIVVEGTVEGDLQAEKSVQIKDTARLKGNVHAPSVSIVEGAQFNGGVAMDVAKRPVSVNTLTARAVKAEAVGK
jgi:cytoskeletal protein CcmA (bactofilin family)